MQKSSAPPKKGFQLNRRLVAGIGLIILMICIALVIVTVLNPPRPPSGINAKTSGTIAVSRGSITGSVLGSGTVNAEQNLSLSFQTSGMVKQVLVQAGDTVTAGQPLAKIDDRTLQSQVANAQASLASAKAKLQQTQNGNATPLQITAAQASVTSAQAAYDAAVKAAESESSTLVSLKATLLKNQVAVQSAQSAYDKVSWQSNIGMLSESADLQKATIDYQKAKADYEAELNTSGSSNQSKIQSALATLQQAKYDLAKLNSSGTESDVAIQQANVQQAEESLKQTQINLENATLKAPFAGVVTSVDIVLGSSVNTGSNAVSLLNRTPLHVNLKLSENDVVKVQPNQPVELTIDSLSDWKAQGTVSFISPSSETSNGVVTYAVRVNLDDKDARVKVGMTANVKIITAQKDNVLVVPNSALLPKGSGHVVQTIGTDGKTIEVDVITGISDGSQTEIVSGVTEGLQIVALPGSTNTSSAGGPFGN